MKKITFALPKGRLAEQTMELLAKIGITCKEMNENSRKLLFVDDKQQYSFFLAKPTDVPTYVEYGAADIGVVGKDILMEVRRSVTEVAILPYQKCKIVVAGAPNALEQYKNGGHIRVGTSFPNIAIDYFKSIKRNVEVIKLNGSVELGAIVGLADVVVDLTSTGSTLKENGLVIFEEICEVSPRVIVNNAAMKLENERISDIVKKLVANL